MAQLVLILAPVQRRTISVRRLSASSVAGDRVHSRLMCRDALRSSRGDGAVTARASVAKATGSRTPATASGLSNRVSMWWGPGGASGLGMTTSHLCRIELTARQHPKPRAMSTGTMGALLGDLLHVERHEQPIEELRPPQHAVLDLCGQAEILQGRA